MAITSMAAGHNNRAFPRLHRFVSNTVAATSNVVGNVVGATGLVNLKNYLVQ